MILPRLFRRRKFLLNNDLQFRFVGALLLQMSFIMASLGLVVHSHVARVADRALTAPVVDLLSRLSFEKALLDNIHGFYLRSLVLIAATGLLIVCFGMVASQRLAGPVHKLDGYLKRIADGNYSQRIAFRGYDHLDEFAASVNEMTESLERRSERASALANELKRLSDELGAGAERTATLDEMDRRVWELRQAV